MDQSENPAGSDVAWQKINPQDIFSDKRLQKYIEESRNSDTSERVYAYLNFMRADEALAEKNEKLYEKLKKKDALVKKMASQMKNAIRKKNMKLAKLLRYISILEEMLKEKEIDYKTIKRKIKDSEIKLSTRAMQGEITTEDHNIAEYVEAVEIELDDEGKEINIEEE